jgi:hypothetical protein
MRWAGHAICIGKMRNAYRGLAENTEGRRPFGSPRLRMEITLKWIVKK